MTLLKFSVLIVLSLFFTLIQCRNSGEFFGFGRGNWNQNYGNQRYNGYYNNNRNYWNKVYRGYPSMVYRSPFISAFRYFGLFNSSPNRGVFINNNSNNNPASYNYLDYNYGNYDVVTVPNYI